MLRLPALAPRTQVLQISGAEALFVPYGGLGSALPKIEAPYRLDSATRTLFATPNSRFRLSVNYTLERLTRQQGICLWRHTNCCNNKNISNLLLLLYGLDHSSSTPGTPRPLTTSGPHRVSGLLLWLGVLCQWLHYAYPPINCQAYTHINLQ